MTDFTLPPVGLRGRRPEVLGRWEGRSQVRVRNPEVVAALRRRALVRRAVVAATAVVLLTIGLTDLRSNVELGQVDHTEGFAQGWLSGLHSNLTLTNANVAIQEDRARFFDVQLTEDRLLMGSTVSETHDTQVSTFYDAVSLSALNSCLGGVIQALDQIGVGQTTGGLTSLNAVGPICQSVAP